MIHPPTALAIAPEIPVISSPANLSAHIGGEYINFSGSCFDNEDFSLSGGALAWVSSKNGPIGTGQGFAINTLKSGTHTITLTGTDSENLSTVASVTITVSNNPPTAVITQPANNSTYLSGRAITFAGIGTDIDTGDVLSYSWSSTFGGVTTVIGSQSVISVSTLGVGTHVIVLTVSDGQGGSTASTPITLNISNNPPTATILSPSDNDSFYPGTVINFNGLGTDTEDAANALTYRWSCNIHGDLSTSSAFTSSALVSGYHTITFDVTDTNGASNTTPQSITLFVGNHSPTATITSPTNGTSYNMGQVILFQGSGIDTEDGSLTGANLVWTSNLEGATPIGTGATFTLSSLQSGTHVITLLASDDYSTPGTGTASVIISVNNTFPTASISSPTNNSWFYPNTNITFSGVATDAEDGALSGTDLIWTSSLSGQIGTGSPLTVNSLPQGDHIITLRATDSSNASTVSSPITITVGNAAPSSTITSPVDEATFNQGDTVTFRGAATDAEDGILTGASLVWSSNIDGVIGTGTILPVSILSTGTHTITLTVTDSQGENDTQTIAITIVNSTPEVTINSPPDGSIYVTGSSLDLTGTAIDGEDGLLSGTSLAWSSSLDGDLGTGTSIPSVVLSKGSHIITLAATDSEGVTGRTTITVHIGNTPPTVAITAPETGTNYDEGEYITFVGTGTDLEDGTLSGASLAWSSSVSGVFATGAIPSPINTLPVGLHTITLSATDSNHAITYSTSISIRVGNTLPVATILRPADLSVFEAGQIVTFEGTGVDAENGVLLDDYLIWTSSRQGDIGHGTSLTLDTLDNGEHTITLTVTDIDGASSSTSITIKAQNTLPVVTITSPAPDSTVDEGNRITFQGTANDYEDGALTGVSLTWSSNLDGQLGTGANLALDTLSSGTHIITLTATDYDDSSASASVNLTIVPMTLSANTLSIASGERGSITIIGGKSPYRVATRRSQIALPSESNGVVSILGVSPGSTLVTVTDNIKKYQEIHVTVTEATTGTGSDNLPDADAGPDQSLVTENTIVYLDGQNLNDLTGNNTSFLWVQTQVADSTQALSPATVMLSDPTSPNPSFTVPLADISGSTLSFQLTVFTQEGSDSDQMAVTIMDNGISNYPPGIITFKSSTGKNMGAKIVGTGELTRLTTMDINDIPSVTIPQTLSYGLITMSITLPSAGGTAVLTVYLPQEAPGASSWYKYMPDQDTWIDFDRNLISNGTGDGAVFSVDRKSITLYIKDDGPYDDNPMDKVVDDPSGLGSGPLILRSVSSSDDGGGGCFVNGVTLTQEK